MGKWIYKVTVAGLNLLSNVTDDKPVNIVKTKCSSGKVSESELINQTDLTNYACDLVITDSKQTTSTNYQVTTQLSNNAILTDLKLTQIGIYATLGDDTTEVLFMIAQHVSEGDAIPSASNSPGFVGKYKFDLTFSNATNVNVEVTEVDVATKTYVVEYVTNAIDELCLPCVVAANDTAEELKKVANYVCDGVNDEVEIHTAINSLTAGGVVVLLQGTYNITSQISVSNSNITIQGFGNAKIIATQSTSAQIFMLSDCNNFAVKDIAIEAYNTTSGIYNRLINYSYVSGNGGSKIVIDNVQLGAYVGNTAYTLLAVGDDAGDIYITIKDCIFNLTQACNLINNYQASENGIGKDIYVEILNAKSANVISIDADTIAHASNWSKYANRLPLSVKNSDGFKATNCRKSMIIVAANDTPATQKAQADYICDGVDDEVEINAAIEQLDGSMGGTVQLMAGSYNISTNQITLKNNTTLQGCGLATKVIVACGVGVGLTVGDIATIKDLYLLDCANSQATGAATVAVYATSIVPTLIIENVTVEITYKTQFVRLASGRCFIRNSFFKSVPIAFEQVFEAATGTTSFEGSAVIGSHSMAQVEAGSLDNGGTIVYAKVAGCVNITGGE